MSSSIARKLAHVPRLASSRRMHIKSTSSMPTLAPHLSPVPRRTFVSTHPRRSQIPSRLEHAISVLYSQPTQKDIAEAGIEADLVPDAKIYITESAAEHLKRLATDNSHHEGGLRVAVESGGCHGYQYKMEFTAHRQPDDYHFMHRDIVPSNVYVDAISLSLLKGSTLDFATELIGSSFRVLDNPQAKGSGCGCGVSWEANI
ncbi:hypothetical protein EW146_g6486 [Bondarzewia mesenterica]|uniref:Core domain-containing protein n=1 Tax=Bondarzewia mesenterica TaxID=1095465 RepID=A0A4S4LNJ2_9AGAM|nr:hypothetical protein EW146_g6486 [Bondarzewia mesenterica]